MSFLGFYWPDYVWPDPAAPPNAPPPATPAKGGATPGSSERSGAPRPAGTCWVGPSGGGFAAA